MRTNSELRAIARERLGGSVIAGNWLVGLAVVLIADVIVALMTSVLAIGAWLCGPVTVGVAAFFLAVMRRRGDTVDASEACFALKTSNRFTRSLLVGLLSTLFTSLWALLFVIPGVIKSYSYALAPYLAVERENLSPRECLDESIRLMDGKKMQLFLMDLSFIGWYLLGILCCGIGIYFVMPYANAARAAFYCEVVSGVYTVGNDGEGDGSVYGGDNGSHDNAGGDDGFNSAPKSV